MSLQALLECAGKLEASVLDDIGSRHAGGGNCSRRSPLLLQHFVKLVGPFLDHVDRLQR